MKIKGKVVMGKQLGRTIGFPTANIQPDKPFAFAPVRGVWTAWIRIESYPAPLGCMLNIGTHPTVPDGAPTVEAHILDFADDIYGLAAEVETLTFIRPEKRFSSVEALQTQLRTDLIQTRLFFEANTTQEEQK